MESDTLPNSYKWSAYQFEHTQKTPDWYWAVGIISVSIATACFVLGDPLLGIIIAVGAFTLAFHSTKHPPLYNYEVNERGIVAHNIEYLFKDLDSFNVTHSEFEKPKLLIQSKKKYLPLITIPIEDQNPDEIKNFLSYYLPEKDHQEPLFHKIFEYLGF